MPSPFPGMDPYLEGPLWTSVHSQLAVEIARQLTPLLVPKYAALTERRLVLATPEMEDGVAISKTSIRSDAAVVATGPLDVEGEGAVAIEAPIQLATIFPDVVPQTTVEIRDTENLQLVAAIEVLSPWNKVGEGYSDYVSKRQSILLSTAHLIEIDLLRSGRRVPMREALPQAPYFVFVGRASARPITQVWPIQLNSPLPTIPIPLLGEDSDAALDLQKVLSSVYDSFGYRYLIDYDRTPAVALPAASAAWSSALLRNAGVSTNPASPN